MKVLIFLASFCFLLNPFNARATAQSPDIIYYQGQQLLLHAELLHSYLQANNIDLKSYFNGPTNFSTACWRGYEATWEITNDSLFLVKIQTCHNNEDDSRPEVDLNKLFGDKFKNQKVFADWVNEKVYAPFGKQLFYVHSGYSTIYEFEYEFDICSGKLIKAEKFDNRKTKRSFFALEKNSDSLRNYINSKINWESLPDIPRDSVVKVDLFFSANENGIIDSVLLLKKIRRDEFTDEAIRVIKTIPSWDILYRHGKHLRQMPLLRISFIRPVSDAENKELINHDKEIKLYNAAQKLEAVKKKEGINDSIKLINFKEYRDTIKLVNFNEYRKENSRDYNFVYSFIDYTPENKYLQKIINRKIIKDRGIGNMIINQAKKDQMLKHTPILSSIANDWIPMLFFRNNLYNYRGFEAAISFTDSVIYCDGGIANAYIIQSFKQVNDNHLQIDLYRGKAETLDIYFVDEKHKLAIFKFSDNRFFQLYCDSGDINRYPVIVISGTQWRDISREKDLIDAENKLYRENLNLIQSKIKEILNKTR